jgi:site-specific recombinase XerC
MRSSLELLADVATNKRRSAVNCPWHLLRYEHTQAIRSELANGYAPATTNKHLSALRGVLKEAWRLGLMTAEDFHRAADLKNVRGGRLLAGRSLTRHELSRLFRVCDVDDSVLGSRDAAVLAVLYGGGLRRAEAISLDLSSIEEGGNLRVIGKGNKERSVPLAKWARRRLAQWIMDRGEEPGALLCRVNPQRGQESRISRRTTSGARTSATCSTWVWTLRPCRSSSATRVFRRRRGMIVGLSRRRRMRSGACRSRDDDAGRTDRAGAEHCDGMVEARTGSNGAA